MRWPGLLLGAVLAAVTLPAAARPMEFSRQGPAADCADCYWILADGEIDDRAPDRFRDFLAREPDPPRLVRLNSTGGMVAFAMRLGQMIREGGFDTVVGQARLRDTDGGADIQPSDCYSACTIAFLGGIRRSVTAGEFGIHRPSIRRFRPDDVPLSREQTKAALRFWITYLSAYALRMGVDAEFVAKSFTDPKIRPLDRADLVRLKVVTKAVAKPGGAKPTPR